jgi:PiT family inorganic phosphate transporter
MTLILTVILVALIFEYINGFHDTANSIATVVSTKVLTPREAIVLAAVTNLVGAMYGTAVAKTISSGLLDSKVFSMTSEVLICALLGGIIWNLITWYFGLPSSSSHALIGGLCGGAVAAAQNNWSVIIWSMPDPQTWYKGKGLLWKVIIPMVTSPACGFVLGFLIMAVLYVALQKMRPQMVNNIFGKMQILSAGSMGFMHGTNDAQKTMGIIALALLAGTKAGNFESLPGWLSFLHTPEPAKGKELENRALDQSRLRVDHGCRNSGRRLAHHQDTGPQDGEASTDQRLRRGDQLLGCYLHRDDSWHPGLHYPQHFRRHYGGWRRQEVLRCKMGRRRKNGLGLDSHHPG